MFRGQTFGVGCGTLALMLASSLAIGAEKKPAAAPKVQGQKQTAAAKIPRTDKLPRPESPQQSKGRGALLKDPATGKPAPLRPGEQLIDRLMKMSPQERERALSNLPPERRENLNKRIENISKLPSAQQTRIQARQQLLESLPPEKQIQVRQAAQQFVKMPEERRAVINQELNRIAAMPDEERKAYMNSDEFRGKYAPKEQQMLMNLAEITPQP